MMNRQDELIPCNMSCRDPIVANSYASTRRFPSTQYPSNSTTFSFFNLETMETWVKNFRCLKRPKGTNCRVQNRIESYKKQIIGYKPFLSL